MSEKGMEIHTGLVPGRIVWGHPMKSQGKVNQDTKQPVMKDGVQVQQWAFGVAFDKAYFQQHIWPTMLAEATTGYPNGVPPRFSWKYTDGDSVDSKGQPFNLREGYAGCYVLTVSTEWKCPEVFKFVNGAYVQCAADEMKTGDYVAMSLNFKVNVATGTNTPSLYVNPVCIELVGGGTEIIGAGAVNPMEKLGGRTYAAVPGMTALGAVPMVQSGGIGMPGTMTAAPAPMAAPQPMMAPQPQPAPAPQPMQQPGMMPTPMMAQPQPMMAPQPMQQPGMMPAPATDFVANAGMPQPMMAPQPQPAPAPQPMQQPGRPVDPSHIGQDASGREIWFNAMTGQWAFAPGR